MTSGRSGSGLGTIAVATALAALAFVLLPVSKAYAPPPPVSKTVYVDVVNGSDSNDGTSAALPLKTIKQALVVSSLTDTISVAPGLYSTVSGESFPLEVYGGRALVSEGGPDVTTVRGEGPPHSVIAFLNSSVGAQLRGFKITGGGGDFAAVYAYRFTGGGPDAVSWPHIVGNHIVDNHASGYSGGGVLVFADPGTPCDAIVEGNLMEGNSAKAGGGVCVSTGSSAVIRNNIIRGNEAVEGGGGIWLTGDSSATVSANDITDNEAGSGGGGGVRADSHGAPVLEDNRIIGNRSDSVGGGVSAISSPRLRMARNELRSNSSSETAGGLYTFQSDVFSQNDVIVGNRTDTPFGPVAGIRSSVGTITLVNDTIADNEATGSPGAWNGIYFDNGATATVIGCSISHSGPDTDPGNAQDIYIGWVPGYPWSFRETTLRQTSMDAGYMTPGNVTTESAYADRAGGDYRPAVGAQLVDSDTAVDPPNLSDVRGYPRPADGDALGTAVADRGAYEVAPMATRVSGTNRYALAAEVASRTFPGYVRTRDVVLASGEDAAVADVLSAAGLCWAYDAPLLLTRKASVPAETRAVLARLRDMDRLMPVVIHVVGGTGSVPDARLAEISALFGAEKVVLDRVQNGGDRYDMARAIANRMEDVRGDEMPHVALIANGADTVKYFDALAVSAVSRHSGAPILLVRSTSVPGGTSAALSELSLSKRYVAGGTSTVSEYVRTKLSATRWSGADRYATAAAIASKASKAGLTGYGTIGVASGLYEALLGATLAGHDDGVLLLARPTSLPGPTGTAISAMRARNAESYVFGTAASISSGVQASVTTRLR